MGLSNYQIYQQDDQHLFSLSMTKIWWECRENKNSGGEEWSIDELINCNEVPEHVALGVIQFWSEIVIELQVIEMDPVLIWDKNPSDFSMDLR